jgi:CheY-like chemotaxis protein
MKQKILLVDESLTVQKVVALTLDKQKFTVVFAKSRTEVIKNIIDTEPSLILMSDSFHDIQWQTFPKEVEAWLGRDYSLPPVVLITSQELEEARHYSGVLRKPFTPQQLQSIVSIHIPPEDAPTELIQRPTSHGRRAEDEEDRLQKTFHESFANEQDLTKQTFDHYEKEEITMDSETPLVAGSHQQPTENTSSRDLWGVGKQKGSSQILDAEDSMAYKASLENKVEAEIGNKDLDAVIDRVLSRMMPPIVERLVQERLDRLLKEQEHA